MRKQIANTTRQIQIASPEEICRSVASDFKLRGLTHAKAATKMGVDVKAVANQISGKRAFGKNAAHLYAKTFGYNESYLLHGEGSLRNDIIYIKDKISKPQPQMTTISQKELKALFKRIAKLETLVLTLDPTQKQTITRGTIKDPTSRSQSTSNKQKLETVELD